MKTQRWADVKGKDRSPAQLAKLDAEIAAEVLAINLRELRESTGRTQAEVAAAGEMAQTELSRIERREDHLLSTLRRYVRALGGELEVCAILDGKRIPLRGV